MKIGSFIECIDDRFSTEQLKKISRIPKKGDYYTVRDIVEYPEYNRVGLRLEEISNPPIEKSDGTLHEPTFNIFRFRELEVPPPIEEEIHSMLEEEFEIINPDDDEIFR